MIHSLPSYIPQVKSGLTDEFSGLRHAPRPPPPSSLITEITCLILPPSHLSPPPTHPTPHYLQLLELATQAGFSVTGIQLTHLSHSSVAALETLGVDTKVQEVIPCSPLTLCYLYLTGSGIWALSDIGPSARQRRLLLPLPSQEVQTFSTS